MAQSSAAIPQQPAPTATMPAEEQEPASAFSLRGALRLLVATGSGRAGLTLFLILVALSAYVLITYPRDFGRSRWSSPLYWADNPSAAPPVWTTWLGKEAVRHQRFTLTEPESVTQRGAAEVRDFRVTIDHTTSEPPEFVSVTLSGITFHSRAPVVVISLIRPDKPDAPVRLANVAVQGPRAGESEPYRRYYDSPLRINLTQQDTASDALAQFFQQQSPDLPPPATLDQSLVDALFGRPAADGSGRIEPLTGEYTISVQALVADTEDEIAPMTVVYGGTVYGWMGTDSLGRDIWQGLLYGFPVALLIATLASLASTIIGASLGILSGYAGGVTDTVIQRLADIVSNVPVLPLLIFLVFVLGSHLYLILLVLVAFSWPGLTILVRSMVLQIRSGQLVEAARALGASKTRIMFRHVFPQVAPFIVAQMIFFAPGAILAEASLSFLGLGDPSIPTWGQMLEAGFRTGALYVGYWWWVIPPGMMIIITAMAFMLLALGMESVVDPRLRNVS